MKLIETIGADTVVLIEAPEMSALAGCLQALSQQFDDIDPGILRLTKVEFQKLRNDFFGVLTKSNQDARR
ncbi:MAG: hypothetical protein JSS82_08180 [Bacteroidetes bacterium]|nr:hypothetical protein [Bacteroidota bacterium]